MIQKGYLRFGIWFSYFLCILGAAFPFYETFILERMTGVNVIHTWSLVQSSSLSAITFIIAIIGLASVFLILFENKKFYTVGAFITSILSLIHLILYFIALSYYFEEVNDSGDVIFSRTTSLMHSSLIYLIGSIGLGLFSIMVLILIKNNQEQNCISQCDNTSNY